MLRAIADILQYLWGFFDAFFGNKTRLRQLKAEKEQLKHKLNEGVLSGDGDYHHIANQLERVQKQIDDLR